jgi:hypothetical protein
MGDKKPKKNSSGNSDAHKAKEAKTASSRDVSQIKGDDKKDKGKK